MTRLRLLAATVVILLPVPLLAQTAMPADPLWSARTRLQLTGTSDSSDPVGYTVYSGVPIELSLRRDLGRRISVEASAALESREIDTIRAGVSPRLNLGSIQTLPLTLLLQARPWSGGRFRPYAGAGLNVTMFWEKSGALDSMDLSAGAGLAVQVGTDIALSDVAVFNVDVKWNQLGTDLESGGVKVARLSINPLSLGIGFGFRF
jgi:outer membrane protein